MATPKRFLERYAVKILGVLHGFDRLVLRGTLRPLAVVRGMVDFLSRRDVRLKDFGAYAERTSKEVRAAFCGLAEETVRPVRYLASADTNKETVARSIAQADWITDGLICVLSCVEPCKSYTL